MRKPELRAVMRAARHRFTSALAPRQLNDLHTGLAAIVRHGQSSTLPGCIGGYWPVGSEIDPRPALAALAADGWQVALPCVSGDALVFRAWPDLSRTPPRDWHGIPEPDEGQPVCMPDVLLVPLLAATPAGGRLGQGKGFYDRTLAASPAFAVGLLYDIQLIETLPLDPWDQPLQALATPSRWIVP